MKEKLGIWIDKEKAILITLLQENHSVKHIESNIEIKERIDGEGKNSGKFGNQFVKPEKHIENKIKQKTVKYLEEITSEIKGAYSVVIFGPAGTKTELKKTIRSNHEMDNVLLEVKTADNMTENQSVAWVKEYYS